MAGCDRCRENEQVPVGSKLLQADRNRHEDRKPVHCTSDSPVFFVPRKLPKLRSVKRSAGRRPIEADAPERAAERFRQSQTLVVITDSMRQYDPDLRENGPPARISRTP